MTSEQREWRQRQRQSGYPEEKYSGQANSEVKSTPQEESSTAPSGKRTGSQGAEARFHQPTTFLQRNFYTTLDICV